MADNYEPLKGARLSFAFSEVQGGLVLQILPNGDILQKLESNVSEHNASHAKQPTVHDHKPPQTVEKSRLITRSG